MALIKSVVPTSELSEAPVDFQEKAFRSSLGRQQTGGSALGRLASAASWDFGQAVKDVRGTLSSHLGDIKKHKEVLPWTQGRVFQIVVSTFVLLNALFLGLETDYNSDPSGDFDFWKVSNVIFTAIFCMELAIRMYSSRLAFLLDRWNLFDSVLVFSSSLDTFVLDLVLSNKSSMGLLSIMRVLRVLRVARVLRLLRFFKPLWLLVAGALDAMRALGWAWFMISIIIYTFAIITTRTIGNPYSQEDPEIDKLFGDVLKSMFTFFQVMTLEGWPDVARQAMKHEPWSFVLFFIFMLLTTFSIMNMVVSVIVDSTLEQSMDQKSLEVQQREAETIAAVVKLDEVFRSADADSDGQLTKAELRMALELPEIKEQLKEAGVDLHQAENVFDVIDYDESGSLDAKEFSVGLLKSRGDAKSQEILALQCDLWRREGRIRSGIKNLCIKTDERMAHVDDELLLLRRDLDALISGLGMPPGA
ncbi:unnamed protein product [Polarella glacialis]|uniref:EF-hand domain-containing protein n=1 Tax=Polarella glacialis TaxID=89957 RepID=A0A813JBQ5_POLGL|nr:unnamed protein product [Polarella glacialis]